MTKTETFGGLTLDLGEDGSLVAAVWNKTRDAATATELQPANTAKLRRWILENVDEPKPTHKA